MMATTKSAPTSTAAYARAPYQSDNDTIVSTNTLDTEHWHGGQPETSIIERGNRRYGKLDRYIRLSGTIPGWTRGDEALELAWVSRKLAAAAVVVEIGAFLGCSTVLLAGGRQVAGSGCVHSIDPFDASGDLFSTPVYQRIVAQLPGTLRDEYDRNLARAGVSEFVKTYVGRAEDVIENWSLPIDMLFMDGDQSREGVRAAYGAWSPFLKIGGILALHSSTSTEPHHDGSYLLANEVIKPPRWCEKRLVRITTFARKARE